MQLTKEQIQKIDNRLHKKGIVYWDLRTEMVDHIVSDIEENAETNDFKIELEKSLEKVGWQKGLYGVNQDGWKNVNRKYRKAFFNEIVNIVKRPSNFVWLVALFTIQYFLSNCLDKKVFDIFNYVLFFLPILVSLIYYIRVWMKRYGKSVNLQYGLSYMSFPLIMLQGIPLFMKDASDENRILMWLLLIPLYYVASFAGYIIYKKAITRVEKMKTQLAL